MILWLQVLLLGPVVMWKGQSAPSDLPKPESAIAYPAHQSPTSLVVACQCYQFISASRNLIKAVKYTKVMLVSCKLQTNREIGCVERQIFDLPRCSAASSQSTIFFVRLEVIWQFGHMSKRVTIPSRIIFPSLCLNEFIRCFLQFVSLIFLQISLSLSC